MSDLIKREDVLKQIWEWVTNREFNYTNATHWLQKRIEAIPTIDAVEVVRCKECVWNDGKGHCKLRYGSLGVFDDVSCDDYCSYGERKGE